MVRRLDSYLERGLSKYKLTKLLMIILFLYSLLTVIKVFSQVTTFSGFINEGEIFEHYIFINNGVNVTFLLEWSGSADLDLRIYAPSSTCLVGWRGILYSCNFSKTSYLNNSIVTYTGFCSKPEKVTVINTPEKGLWKIVIYSYKGSSNYLLKVYLNEGAYEKRVKTLWSPSLWEVVSGNVTSFGSKLIVEGKGGVCSVEKYSNGEFNVKLKVKKVKGAEYIISIGLPEEDHIEIARIIPYDRVLKVITGIYKEGASKWSYVFYVDNPEEYHTYKVLWSEHELKVYVDNNLSVIYTGRRLLSDISDGRVCIMANSGKIVVKDVNVLSSPKGVIKDRGMIKEGDIKEFKVDVGTDVSVLKIYLNWEDRNNDLDLYLITPTGDRIGWEGVFSKGGEGVFKGMRIKYTSFLSKPEFIEVNMPIKGRWKVVISGRDVKVLEVYELVIERE